MPRRSRSWPRRTSRSSCWRWCQGVGCTCATTTAPTATCAQAWCGVPEAAVPMSGLAVLGAGAWGTALASALARSGRQVTLWARDPAQAQTIGRLRRNERYLPEIELPARLAVTASLPSALEGAGLALAATPVAGLRQLLGQLRAEKTAAPLVWLCKGFEQGTGRLPHQIVSEALATAVPSGALSGPSFALEVARGLPC